MELARRCERCRPLTARHNRTSDTSRTRLQFRLHPLLGKVNCKEELSCTFERWRQLFHQQFVL